MRKNLINELNSYTKDDAIKFFADCKDKDKFLEEATEFANACWERMLELLKDGSDGKV